MLPGGLLPAEQCQHDAVWPAYCSQCERLTSSCLQDDPNLLWLVAGGCTFASTLTFLGVYGYWRFWPNRRHQRRVRDMTALRDLLVHHADDLDEILAKLRNKSGKQSGLFIASC